MPKAVTVELKACEALAVSERICGLLSVPVVAAVDVLLEKSDGVLVCVLEAVLLIVGSATPAL